MADKTYELRFGLSDGTVVPLRFTVPQGPKGDDGIYITKAKINENGHLIVTLSDDQEIDTGVAKGLDAFSPVVSVTQIAGGNKLSITDANGTKSFDILDGKQGDPGTSVTVQNVSESTADGGSNVVTFSDGKSLTVKNGSKGSPGDKGDPPIIAVNPIDGGNRLVITGANGSKAFNVMDGKQGDPGVDGYSPTIEVKETDTGHIVSVTDKNGTQSFAVLNGSGGGNTQVNYETQVYNKPFGDVFQNGVITSQSLKMFSEGVHQINETLSHMPVVGQKYTVNVNGVSDFESTAREYQIPGFASPFIAIGNIEAVSGGESTGEAAAFLVYPEEATKLSGVYAEMYVVAWVEDPSQSTYTSYSVKGNYIVHTDKINKKFLPDDVGTLVSWPDIKNKPFGEITITELVCLPETTVEFDPEMMEGEIVSAPENEIVTGETYTVNWNSMEYTCTAQSFDGLGVPAAILGNLGALTGGDDTGEPFIIAMYPAEIAAEMGAYVAVLALDGSVSATLSISQKKETVSKLNNEYLGLFWLPTEMTDNAEFEWVAETEIDTTDTFNIRDAMPDGTQFATGNKIAVYIDGVRYENTIADLGGQYLYAGNASLIFTGLGDTGEPYVILANETGLFTMNIAMDDMHRVSVYMLGYGPNKLPVQFLPEDHIKRLINDALAGFSSAEEASF